MPIFESQWFCVSAYTLKGQRVAVTGASGFVGRHLVESLVQRGAHVVAVTRKPCSFFEHLGNSVENKLADLNDVEAMTRAFEETSAVVANAALIALGLNRKSTVMQTNVKGVENTFEALIRSGTKRVIYMSSVTAYRPKGSLVFDESHALRDPDEFVTPFGYYGASKAKAEQIATALAEKHNLKLSIVRPSGIYGAHDRVGITHWITKVASWGVGLFPAFFYMPSVYVVDLCDALCAMLSNDETIGKAYNLSGRSTHSYWDFLKAYRHAGGRVSSVVLPIPLPLRYAYNTSRAEKELGFKNTDLVTALREVIELEPSRKRLSETVSS